MLSKICLPLADRNLNITKYFMRTIKIFEDFKLVQGLREEINYFKFPSEK